MKKSYAKINLSLNVLNKNKPKDLHDLDMINCQINLFDTISLKIYKNKPREIQIICNDKDVPTDEQNLVYKVIEKFQKIYHLDFKAKVYLKKKIPVCSGLGGGSSNAATVLEMLNHHFKKKMDVIAQRNFLLPITSDGPYMVTLKQARVKENGGKITLIPSKFKAKIYLVKPKSGCLTKDVYNNIDYATLKHSNINKIEEALINNDFNTLAKHINNDLLDSACKLNMDVKDVLTRLKSCGFEIVSMSGSGSACFAISNRKTPYRFAKKIFQKTNYDLCGVYKIKKVNY